MKLHGNNRLLIGIIILVVVLGGIIWYGNSMDKDDIGNECVRDSDCVPVPGCHPDSCVLVTEYDDSLDKDIFCTAECRPGTLDCGQGSCLCIDGKCRAEINDLK